MGSLFSKNGVENVKYGFESFKNIDKNIIIKGQKNQMILSYLPYFGFRKAFPILYGENFNEEMYTTDAGWGCMYRSAQTIISHILLESFQIDKNHSDISNNDHHSTQYIMLLKQFLDSSRCSFSIHRMFKIINRSSRNNESNNIVRDVYPGKWIGPATAARIIKETISKSIFKSLLKVYIADNGIIIDSEIEKILLDIKNYEENDNNDRLKWNDMLLNTTAISMNSNSSTIPSNLNENVNELRPKPMVVVLIPLLLAVKHDTISNSLMDELIWLMSREENIGMLGGEMNRAMYILGVETTTTTTSTTTNTTNTNTNTNTNNNNNNSKINAHNTHFLALDPHLKPVMSAIKRITAYDLLKFVRQSTISASWAGKIMKRLNPKDLDPCLCLAMRFYSTEQWNKFKFDLEERHSATVTATATTTTTTTTNTTAVIATTATTASTGVHVDVNYVPNIQEKTKEIDAKATTLTSITNTYTTTIPGEIKPKQKIQRVLQEIISIQAEPYVNSSGSTNERNSHHLTPPSSEYPKPRSTLTYEYELL